MPEWFDATMAFFKTSCSHTRKKLKGKKEENSKGKNLVQVGARTQGMPADVTALKKDPFHLFRNVKHYFFYYVLNVKRTFSIALHENTKSKNVLVYTRLIVAI